MSDATKVELEIYAIPVLARGRFYIMPYPKTPEIFSALSVKGVDVVISFLEPQEAAQLSLGLEKTLWEQTGGEFHNFPIEDFALPRPDVFAQCVSLILSELVMGRNVAIHCHAGIGRSGMVACGVLVALGQTSLAALDAVSLARGTQVPDTQAQRDFVMGLSN